MWARGSGSAVRPACFPLSDRFAEMGGIPVNDDGGEQVEPGHAVVLALAPIDSSGNSAACMPPASIPSAISPNSSPSQDQPSIAHSTGAFPLSVRSCPLPPGPVLPYPRPPAARRCWSTEVTPGSLCHCGLYLDREPRWKLAYDGWWILPLNTGIDPYRLLGRDLPQRHDWYLPISA